MIEIFTDGACSGNPGKGAWSCIVYDGGRHLILDAKTGSDINTTETTNNRMEILGLLNALDLATQKYKEEECKIYCDSAYCVNMFNLWINNWAANNWINSSKQTVKNLDLIKQLYKYKKIDFPNFEVIKIQGHQDEIGNILADAFARRDIYNESAKLAKILKDYGVTLV